MKKWETDLDNMVYIIRDEGTLPLGVLCYLYGENNVAEAQSDFVEGLKKLMQGVFSNAKIVVINAMEQLEKTKADLEGNKTISLDTFYKGTYDIEITRLFKQVKGKTEFIRLIARGNTSTIKEQISKIEPGNYVLVDDDAVGGRTIQSVKELLPSNVNITKTYLMMDSYRNKENEPILDVVDCRDFLVGVQGCGLTTVIDGIGVVRTPYMYPFVDIEDKANIPCGMEIEVSKQLWELNRKFWTSIDKNAIPLNCGGVDFAKLIMHYKIGKINSLSMQSAIDKFSRLTKKGVYL